MKDKVLVSRAQAIDDLTMQLSNERAGGRRVKDILRQEKANFALLQATNAQLEDSLGDLKTQLASSRHLNAKFTENAEKKISVDKHFQSNSMAIQDKLQVQANELLRNLNELSTIRITTVEDAKGLAAEYDCLLALLVADNHSQVAFGEKEKERLAQAHASSLSSSSSSIFAAIVSKEGAKNDEERDDNFHDDGDDQQATQMATDQQVCQRIHGI